MPISSGFGSKMNKEYESSAKLNAIKKDAFLNESMFHAKCCNNVKYCCSSLIPFFILKRCVLAIRR